MVSGVFLEITGRRRARLAAVAPPPPDPPRLWPLWEEFLANFHPPEELLERDVAVVAKGEIVVGRPTEVIVVVGRLEIL